MRCHTLLPLFAFLAIESRGQDAAFYRLSATGETTMVGIEQDGSVTWTNASSDGDVQVQRSSPANWEDYVRIPVTGATQTAMLYDPASSADRVLIPAGSFVTGNATNVFPDGEGYGSSSGIDPRGPASSSFSCRVLRGSSWGFYARAARVAFRNISYSPPDAATTSYGFRCVRGL